MNKSLSVILVLLTLAVSASPAAAAQSDEQAALAFAQALAAGKSSLAVNSFDATMRGALPASQLNQVWQSLNLAHGGLKKFGAVRSETLGPYKVCYVPAVFSDLTVDLKVVFNGQHRIGGFYVVPHSEGYKPAVRAAGLVEKATKVVSGPYNLDALWTMPAGPGPFPAVILVHGSGPQDKDESLGPNKPFKDLADGLASRGIAVLRYERRTRQDGKVLDVKNLTVQDETIDDALAAVKTARACDAVDASRIFVLGHSLGGTLVPRIALQAQANEPLAGCVVMAGAVRPMEDLLIEQTEYILGLEPSSSKGSQMLADLKEKVKLVKSTDLSVDTPAEKLPLGVPAKYWLDLRGYNPPAEALKSSVPMLFLQGGRDYQVTSADFKLWQEGLKGQSRYAFKNYPNLSHLFMPGQGMATPEEYMSKAGHVAPAVLDDIAGWIKAGK